MLPTAACSKMSACHCIRRTGCVRVAAVFSGAASCSISESRTSLPETDPAAWSAPAKMSMLAKAKRLDSAKVSELAAAELYFPNDAAGHSRRRFRQPASDSDLAVFPDQADQIADRPCPEKPDRSLSNR